jgi:hypothetical protein
MSIVPKIQQIPDVLFLESEIHSYKNLYTTSENFTEGDKLPDDEASITSLIRLHMTEPAQRSSTPA